MARRASDAARDATRATAALRRVARLALPRAARTHRGCPRNKLLQQSCERERFAAPRQKVSPRVRAPAFAGATTGLTKNKREGPGTRLARLPKPYSALTPLATTCDHLVNH